MILAQIGDTILRHRPEHPLDRQLTLWGTGWGQGTAHSPAHPGLRHHQIARLPERIHLGGRPGMQIAQRRELAPAGGPELEQQHEGQRRAEPGTEQPGGPRLAGGTVLWHHDGALGENMAEYGGNSKGGCDPQQSGISGGGH